MRQSTRRWFAAGLMALVAMAGGCQPVRKDLTIPLSYRPDSSVSMQAPLINSPGLKLYVEVLDDRPDKTKVGENIEDEVPKPIFAGTPEPAEFVHDAVIRELTSMGLAVVADKGAANRILSLRLIRFYCVETAVYDAEVRANAAVSDAGGNLWTGLVFGAKRNFGRSLSAENYQESFSEAVQRMVAQMVNSSDFQKAVVVK